MKIGVAGLGLMGSAIATRLAGTTDELSVYNRTKARAEHFSEKADVVSTPSELGQRCDFIITVVTDYDAVQEIFFGDNGITKSVSQNLIIADASTISPSQSKDCARRLREKGIEMLGMPVMGGPSAAEAGDLVPIVAGSKSAFERVKPVIERLASNVFYVGEKDGSANAIKLALNLNIALVAVALSEGITLVRSCGIEPSLFVRILNSTYFKTGLSEKKGPRMATGDFQPTFYLRNMLKDLELATGTAQEQKITLPQTALAQQLYRAANNTGFFDKDYTAVCGFLAQINGLNEKKRD